MLRNDGDVYQYNLVHVDIEPGSLKTVLLSFAICKIWSLIKPVRRLKKCLNKEKK